jgi:hypothetical protein
MRYFNASSQPYISDFVPQNMELIYKMQQDLIKEDEAANLDLEKNKVAFDIKGGYGTSEAAQKLSQQYNDETNKIAAELASGNLKPRDASLRAKTLLYHFATNPEVNFVKADYAMMPKVDQMKKENPGFMETGLAEGWNPQTKTWNQINSIKNQSELDQYYNGITHPGYVVDHKQFYDDLKPDLLKTKDEHNWTTIDDGNGNLIKRDTVYGKTIKELNEEKVRKAALNYLNNDSGAWNKKSVMYDQLKHSNEFPGSKLGAVDIAENMTKAFSGYFTEENESSKGSQDIVIPGKGKKSKEEGKDSETILNPFIEMVSPQTTAVSDENLDGLFRPNPDGSHQIPLEGAITNFAKASGADPEIEKINSFGMGINKIKDKYGYNKNPETIIISLEKNDPKNDYYNKGQNVYKKSKDGKNSEILVGTQTQIINNEIKNTPEYEILKEQAKEQGVNINAEDFNVKYKESLGKYSEEIQSEIGRILEIGGEAKFVVDPGNNKVNVDDNVFISGKAIMTKKEWNARFEAQGKDNRDSNIPSPFTDEWEEIYLEPGGAGYGSIKFYAAGDSPENDLYSVDIKKQIPVERTIARSYNKAAFGESFNSKVDTELNNSFNEFKINQIDNKRSKIYSNIYESNPNKFKESIAADVKSLDENSKVVISNLITEIDAEKDSIKKKQAYIELKKLLQNKEELPIFIEQLIRNKTMGKPKAGQRK